MTIEAAGSWGDDTGSKSHRPYYGTRVESPGWLISVDGILGDRRGDLDFLEEHDLRWCE